MTEQSNIEQTDRCEPTQAELGSVTRGSALHKIRVIASATYREVTRQPVYYILVGVFGVLVFFSPLFALFHFEEKDMVMEIGIASLMAAGIFIAVVASGFSISREMDRMIPFSILCKPVRRSHFLLGKFVGIYLAVVVAIVFLTLMMMLSIDNFRAAHELAYYGKPLPLGSNVWNVLDQYLKVVGVRQMLPVLCGALVTIFGLSIITAFAVSVAVHFPLVVTGAICVLVFIVGNLASFAIGAAQGGGRVAKTVAWGCHALLPNIGIFNMTNIVAVDKRIGPSYMAATAAYSIAYTAAVLLVGVAFFARKEIR